MTRQNDLRTRDMAKASFATHVMREEISRSFHFSNPDGRSAYWFSLTWTPGTMTLSGDIGELVLTHYHAMPRFERAISWVATSDYHYLMGKSNASEEYDPAATLAFIVETANEEPINAVAGRRHYSGPNRGKRCAGFRDYWRAASPAERDDADYLLNTSENPYLMEERRQLVTRPLNRQAALREAWDYHECWEMWLEIWLQTAGFDYYVGRSWNAPTMVLTPGGRRELKRLVEEEIQDQGSAADFLRRIGFDDYYGSTKYNDRTIWQIEAMQHGCRMILASLPQQEAAA